MKFTKTICANITQLRQTDIVFSIIRLIVTRWGFGKRCTVVTIVPWQTSLKLDIGGRTGIQCGNATISYFERSFPMKWDQRDRKLECASHESLPNSCFDLKL
jgi:hypothetical protein